MIVAGSLVTGELGPVVTIIHEADKSFSTQSMDFESDLSANAYWREHFKGRSMQHEDGALYIGCDPSSVSIDIGNETGVLKLEFDNGQDHASLAVVACSAFIARTGWPLVQGMVTSDVINCAMCDVARPPKMTDIMVVQKALMSCLMAAKVIL